MDFYKAISILGLSFDYTEKEFKNAYRKLSQEYHPDKYVGTSQYEIMQKKQQEISSAREFLKKHSKNNNRSFSVYDYLNYKKSELSKIIANENNSITDKDYIETKNKIKEDIRKFTIDISKTYILLITKEDIDKLYNKCINEIKVKYENLKKIYYQKNSINEEKVKEEINYDCSLEEFYLQLQKIEEKYGKIAEIKQQLSEDIKKYQYFKGYNEIKTTIEKKIKSILKKIKEDDFQNIQKYTNELHKDIENLFQIYHNPSQIIKEIEIEVYNINDEAIKQKFEKLKNDFTNGISFESFILEFEHLKIAIKKQNKILEFKRSEQEINTIYQNLLDQYNKVIKNYNIITDIDTITKFNELLIQILKVFSKGGEEQKNIDFFRKFQQITFIDIENDKEIIEKSIKELKKEKINVYLKKYDEYPTFYYLDEQNMLIYRVSYHNITCDKITKEILKQEYNPLEETLETATFIGDNRQIHKTLYGEFLYETENLIIYKQMNNFKVDSKENLSDSIIIKKDQTLEIFKDRQNLCKMIEKQLKLEIEEYKNMQSSNQRKR